MKAIEMSVVQIETQIRSKEHAIVRMAEFLQGQMDRTIAAIKEPERTAISKPIQGNGGELDALVEQVNALREAVAVLKAGMKYDQENPA